MSTCWRYGYKRLVHFFLRSNWMNWIHADEDEMDSESEEDETSLPERPNKLIKMA